MQVQTITIQGSQYAYDSVKDTENADVQALLASCHARAELRPLCNCTGKGIPLQIRRLGNVYHLARMPEGGLSHSTDCGFYGETEHSSHQYAGENIKLAFSLSLSQSDADGDITLAGLLNLLWTRANLHRWGSANRPRSWKHVADRLYKAVKGLKFNGISVSKLLWVMPSMEDNHLAQMRESCLNFVKACKANGHVAIIIAPIGTSEYQEGGTNCLRFRVMDKLPLYIPYRKFPFKTYTLKPQGEYPYPVAISLVTAADDKAYLKGLDIAMLWMTRSYLPCSTIDRVKSLTDVMDTAEYLQVPLNQRTGAINPETALIKANGRLNPMRSVEPIPQLPWNINDK